MADAQQPELNRLNTGQYFTGLEGLSAAEVSERLAKYGPNSLIPEERHWFRRAGIVLRLFSEPMALLLLAAGLTYLVVGDRFDAAVTLGALAPITLVTVLLEARGERALEQLRRLTAPTVEVFREGRAQEVPAEDIVPGDLFFVKEGAIVPADGTVVHGDALIVDESSLTGESLPLTKNVADDNAVFAGTTVLSGRGVARTTATGPATRYGRVGTLVASVRPPQTPLRRAIRRLLWQVGAVAASFCLAVILLELASGRGWAAAIIAGVSLAMAAVPEEFPMVYTLYLGLGAWRLARKNGLVRQLDRVETLGSTSVICADKTGTLTVGHLDVAGLYVDGAVLQGEYDASASARSLLTDAVLASEPQPFDPLEQAILRSAAAAGVEVDALHLGRPVSDYPFDPHGKYMSHVWRLESGTRVCAKGAVEGILDKSNAPSHLRPEVLETNQFFASHGMRVIAVAAGDLIGASGDRTLDETALRFRGLIGFNDPVRDGVPDAIAACHSAGIRVVMITGDHPVTAFAVAQGLALVKDNREQVLTGEELDSLENSELDSLVGRINVFARIRPEQKFRIVRALRARGEVVAMTGDGINDAPALREADIGVAMGQRGTEVARSAAGIVLLDDNFSTIVGAVEDGRRIFDNLRRAFSYLIAFHVPMLLAALIVPLVDLPLLLLPVHLVWLELIVHPTASLVFEGRPASVDLMRRPPRRLDTPLVRRADAIRCLVEGSALFLGVLGLYLWSLTMGRADEEARAMAVVGLIIGQMLILVEELSGGESAWRIPWRHQPVLIYVLVGALASLLAAVQVAPLSRSLHLSALNLQDWAASAIVASAGVLWMELAKAFPFGKSLWPD